jgi:hypothetical protein
MTKSQATPPIPVQLSGSEFIAFIFPHLSMPRRGSKCKLGYQADGTALIHYTTIYKVFAKWADDGSLEQAFIASVRHLAQHHQLDLSILHGDGTNTVAKKGGDGIGYSGHKHQRGEKIIAIVDNNGFVLAPLPVAPVNETDTVLLPQGLNTLKRVARLTDLNIDGSHLNLDGGFDSRHNRKAIFNAGLIPNIKENPRNRKTPKRGRKRLFDAAIWRPGEAPLPPTSRPGRGRLATRLRRDEMHQPVSAKTLALELPADA